MIESMQGAWCDVAPRQTWLPTESEPIQQIFIIVLTADGEEAFEIPVSTIQIRLRDVSGSYLACTVPNPTKYTTEILARADGKIYLYGGQMVSGVRNLELIMYANTQNIYFDQGAQNALTVTGARYETHSNPRTVIISNESKVSKGSNGRYSVRTLLDPFIRPNDIITVNGETFTADLILCTIKASNAYMDIQGE